MRLFRWFGALASWLAEPRVVWLTLLVLVLSMAVPLVGGATEREIQLSGVVLQVLGVVVAACGFLQTRRLFGLPPVRLLARSWFSRFPAFRGRIVRATATATATGDATARAHVWSDMDDDAPHPELLRVLIRNLERLNERVARVEASCDAGKRTLSSAIGQEQRARAIVDSEISAMLESSQTNGLWVSLAGLVWVWAGLLLSALSTEIARVLG